jgi:hypothetical protein
VSENQTRVSAEYLNGGRLSVVRPSSGASTRPIVRRTSLWTARAGDDAIALEPSPPHEEESMTSLTDDEIQTVPTDGRHLEPQADADGDDTDTTDGDADDTDADDADTDDTDAA